MPGKKYTLEEISKDPELRREVCERPESDDPKPSGGGDSIFSLFTDVVGVVGEIAADTAKVAGEIAADTAKVAGEIAVGGSSKKDKK